MSSLVVACLSSASYSTADNAGSHQWAWNVSCRRRRSILSCLFNAIFTGHLHVMQRTVLLSQFCPSVCLSDACIVTKLNDALQIFWYHTKRQSLWLVFWHKHWLVGDAPFLLNYFRKWPIPCVKLIVPCNQYFICIRQMAFWSRYSCLANNYGVSPCTEPLAVLTAAQCTFRT